MSFVIVRAADRFVIEAFRKIEVRPVIRSIISSHPRICHIPWRRSLELSRAIVTLFYPSS